ncbi:MAG: nickel-type superoxide dismutase maturation protease [Patescibacteria group bacterium]
MIWLPIIHYKIFGQSMSITLQNGQHILVNRCAFFFKQPQVGDIVAAKDPRDGKILIKRIAKKEKQKYFLMGDNPAHSTDSRTFGMIDRKNILGKVIFF